MWAPVNMALVNEALVTVTAVETCRRRQRHAIPLSPPCAPTPLASRPWLPAGSRPLPFRVTHQQRQTRPTRSRTLRDSGTLRPSQAGSLPGYVLGVAAVFRTEPDCSCKPDMKVKLVVHSRFDGCPFNAADTRRRAGLEFQTAAGGRMKLRPVAAPTIWHGTARKSLARPTAHEYAPPARKPAPA